MDGQPYYMRPWDEVLGTVHSIEEAEGCCLALISKIPVLLPQELAVRLREFQNQRIGILRTDTDYRLRVITPPKPAIEAESISLGIGAL